MVSSSGRPMTREIFFSSSIASRVFHANSVSIAKFMKIGQVSFFFLFFLVENFCIVGMFFFVTCL